MKPVYVRENLKITAFETEDVIRTSAPDPDDPLDNKKKAFGVDNRFARFSTFMKTPNNWFDD